MLLSVDNLHVSYGRIAALRGVSLQINAGEIVSLIGSNGAGKSTLLRTISGLLKPQSGSIRFSPSEGTIELTKQKPHQIVRFGLSQSPEGRQVFASLSVMDNLLLGAYAQKGDRGADLDHCFSLFPILKNRSAQRAGTLSGGEQQMLAMARALMQRPQLLLLDEPSLGLAPLIVRKIFEIIRQINAEGTTVFLVEQNAKQALGIAHRAYVLQTGEVIKTGTGAELADDPDIRKAYLGG